jgi:hypothetical protein
MDQAAITPDRGLTPEISQPFRDDDTRFLRIDGKERGCNWTYILWQFPTSNRSGHRDFPTPRPLVFSLGGVGANDVDVQRMQSPAELGHSIAANRI